MKKTMLLIVVTAVAVSACKKLDVQGVSHPLANEFLTTTILNLQNLNNALDKPSVRYKVIGTTLTPSDTLRLANNSTYSCTIVILDETKTPVDTVSKVIWERANIHLFFFRPSAGLNFTDSITDHDTNVPPLPVGISSQVKTGAPSSGTLELILRHQPNVKNGTYAPGSTDLDAFYPVKIN